MVHQKKKVTKFVLSLIDSLNLIFILIMVGFLITTHDYNPYTDRLYALYGILTVFILSLSYFRRKWPQKGSNLVFLITAFVVFVILYDSISGLLPVFAGTTRYDKVIDDWDKAFFGISPSVWSQKIMHPVITEVFYWLYFIYFLIPVLLIVLLYRKRAYLKLEISMFTIFINYYGAYICYFFVPVQGPRYYLVGEHTKSLDGILISGFIRDFINYFEPSTLDCFPSLHASILVVVTMLSARYFRSLYKTFLIISIIIIFSLIYLRYHYVLDIIAGILWAVISVYLGRWIYHKYNRYFQNQLMY
ncbi:MAG: phosphatase PAP2 family protein [Saprospiraceae bacterium]|nr:phosphatase PAP2 family protein [Saprospiraceae bacterium]